MARPAKRQSIWIDSLHNFIVASGGGQQRTDLMVTLDVDEARPVHPSPLRSISVDVGVRDDPFYPGCRNNTLPFPT